MTQGDNTVAQWFCRSDVKISNDIDCSPEEAPAFLGLPDVKPLQNYGLERLFGIIPTSISHRPLENHHVPQTQSRR